MLSCSSRVSYAYSIAVFAGFVGAWGASAEDISSGASSDSFNGALWDQGAGMQAPAPSAPQALLTVRSLVGEWAVGYSERKGDDIVARGHGSASITYLNRGHGLLQAVSIRSPQGSAEAESQVSTLAFLVPTPSVGLWSLGEADGRAERVRMFSGPFAGPGDELRLTSAERRLGGPQLITTVRSYTIASPDAFTMREVEHTQGVAEPTRETVLEFRRSGSESNIWPNDGFGRPASVRPAGARSLDFLVGGWDSLQTLSRRGADAVRFPSRTVAVWVLEGKGVLEHTYYDVDPSKPDAASSVLRLFNRATQQWECLFVENRSNWLIHFGGPVDGDEILLRNFGAGATDPTISRFRFAGVDAKSSYTWTGEDSRDQGETFDTSWKIEFRRVEELQPPPRRGRGGR